MKRIFILIVSLATLTILTFHEPQVIEMASPGNEEMN